MICLSKISAFFKFSNKLAREWDWAATNPTNARSLYIHHYINFDTTKVCIPIVCKTCLEFKTRMNIRKMCFRTHAENSNADFHDTQFDV